MTDRTAFFAGCAPIRYAGPDGIEPRPRGREDKARALPWTCKGPGGPLTPLLAFLAAQQPINDIDIRFWAASQPRK